MLAERLAQAMWAEHMRRTGAAAWGAAPQADRDHFIEIAQAGLIAISQPSSEMMRQGNDAFHAWEKAQEYRSPVGEIFRAMIGSELPPKDRGRLETADDF